MTTTLQEFERLAAIFRVLGHELTVQSPATENSIESIAETTGIQVDNALKELWRITDGSGDQHWFCHSNSDLTPYLFLPVKDVVNGWDLYSPRETAQHWFAEDENRDSRIKRRLIYHHRWLPCAAFHGGSRILSYDADPTPEGQIGQIINCVYAPEYVLWVANDFLSLFRTSNDFLEREIKDNPERVASLLHL